MAFTVYESMECREAKLEERVAFMQSVEKLAKVGIEVTIVSVSSSSDIDECSEAWELVENDGMPCLPVSDYNGVVVDSGDYPSDQILADYLDVPDGILSANKTSGPAAGDNMQSCCCCNKY